jgi:hypothetical protein
MNKIIHYFKVSTASLLLLSIMSCGGGGSTSIGNCSNGQQSCGVLGTINNGNSSGITIGDPEKLANFCTPNGEKAWVRAHLNDVYLWYKQIVEVPIANYSTPQLYFDALLVKRNDRFSFTAPKAEIDSYFDAGEDIGFGYSLINEGGKLRVTYTEPASPAFMAQVSRGAQIFGINGKPIEQASYDEQIAALYPSKSGTVTHFEMLDLGASKTRLVDLTSTAITTQPVLENSVISTPDNKKIGYLVFTDHIATAEAPLIESMRKFQMAGIDDLVIDLRYNGGGYLYIANELASMVAGNRALGKVFEQLRFNDKHPDWTAQSKNLFSTTAKNGTTLPQLNLSRVFVLTTARTCSASESIINGLSPFVQVITIGGDTCGKPYGFTQTDNCDTAYFAIEFDGVNDAGNGGYVNGFAPTCPATDDLDHTLGDMGERLLAKAINYRRTGVCGTTNFGPPPQISVLPQYSNVLNQQPHSWRNNRIVNTAR